MKAPQFLKAFIDKKMFIILLMGISSGLPLALTGGTLQAWMKSEGVDLGTIGLFALVGLPYTLKFLWSPLVDRFSLGLLGRRRSWMLLSQVLLILSVLGLGYSDPKADLQTVALLALLLSFFSATQDIVLDAWRREALTDAELGLGSSIHVTGYLFSFRMISGAGALILSDFLPWSTVYLIMAIVLGLGVLATFMAHEPKVETAPPRTLKEAVWEPFLDFFNKPQAIWILIFILLYKVGDNMAQQMSTPLYLDLGFSRTEIGAVTKVLGWVSLTIGGIVGGAALLRISLFQALFIFGFLQAISNFGFALLTWFPKDTTALSVVIAFENFTTGLGSTAFVAYMASLTNRKFTATQYALLTSFMGIPRTILNAPTGYMAKYFGWFNFFVFCTAIALPGLIILNYLRKKSDKD